MQLYEIVPVSAFDELLLVKPKIWKQFFELEKPNWQTSKRERKTHMLKGEIVEVSWSQNLKAQNKMYRK